MREKHRKTAKSKSAPKARATDGKATVSKRKSVRPLAIAEKRRSVRPPSPTERPSSRPLAPSSRSLAPSSRPLAPTKNKEDVRTFVHTFFKKGAEFTEELLRENDKLRRDSRILEIDNASLRTQLASDEAIRDLLKKIDRLEREKVALLSHITEAEAVSTRVTTRYSEMEEELSTLANLYVAGYQLHSTLHLPRVIKHIQELLQQLVGARTHAIYMSDPAAKELVLV